MILKVFKHLQMVFLKSLDENIINFLKQACKLLVELLELTIGKTLDEIKAFFNKIFEKIKNNWIFKNISDIDVQHEYIPKQIFLTLRIYLYIVITLYAIAFSTGC